MVPVTSRTLPFLPMTDVLIVSDSPRVVDEVRSALEGPDTRVRSVRTGRELLPAARASLPDLVVLDLQVGSMGGMAACMELRLEESGARLDYVPVLMLIDRRPDVFLARRSGAEGWVMKPLDPLRLRRAARAVIDGEEYHDATGLPETSPAASPAIEAEDTVDVG
jgi:DNA-binding response OmpR family regulator